jgi:hypothetical protein
MTLFNPNRHLQMHSLTIGEGEIEIRVVVTGRVDDGDPLQRKISRRISDAGSR